MFIEATRRASRAAVDRIREALVEYDSVVFADVDLEPEDVFQTVRDGGTYVVAFNDPTIPEPVEERTYDCGD